MFVTGSRLRPDCRDVLVPCAFYTRFCSLVIFLEDVICFLPTSQDGLGNELRKSCCREASFESERTHSSCRMPFLRDADFRPRVFLRPILRQSTRENNVRMFRDMREAVDGVDPDRDTFAYSDK